jgi:hypothetical protein
MGTTWKVKAEIQNSRNLKLKELKIKFKYNKEERF